MKKVLLDCGANIGQSYEWFMKNRDDSDEYEVHCFEPVPSFKHYFENKNLTFHSDAVWVEDGTIDFYDKGGLSSTLYANKHASSRSYPSKISTPELACISNRTNEVSKSATLTIS